MSYFSEIYRNFDAHFAEGNSSMVSFPNCTELGSIVFVRQQGSQRAPVLGQLNEKFKSRSGTIDIEADSTRAELRNVMVRMPLFDLPISFSKPATLPEGCKIIISTVDCTSDLPEDFLLKIAEIRHSVTPVPEIHVFVTKTELIDRSEYESGIKERIRTKIPNVIIHDTTLNDGSALYHVGQCIESLIVPITDLRDSINNFARSLGLSHAFLVDLQSRAFFLSSDIESMDIDSFAIAQDGVEMFVGIATMMDARSAQACASVELKDGRFFHFFWSAYDVILAGIGEHNVPTATAKNNVIDLLYSI
jgi:hypothetical protein